MDSARSSGSNGSLCFDSFCQFLDNCTTIHHETGVDSKLHDSRSEYIALILASPFTSPGSGYFRMYRLAMARTGESRSMNFLILYLLLLKATLSSFSGLAALPILREDFVVKYQLLTDRELNTALVLGKMTPGPKGLYIVSLGYFSAGDLGAFIAWLAIITPALIVIPLIRFASRKVNSPEARRTLNAVVLASAGISLSATFPLAADALNSPLTYGIALVSLIILLFTKIDSFWVIIASAFVAIITASIQFI